MKLLLWIAIFGTIEFKHNLFHNSSDLRPFAIIGAGDPVKALAHETGGWMVFFAANLQEVDQ